MRSAVAIGCDRLVSARVRAPQARLRAARLVGVLLTLPVAWAAAAWLLVPAVAGLNVTVALVGCGLFLSWVLSAGLMSGRAPRLFGGAALLAGALALAPLIAAAGGLSSPAALLLAVPAVEACAARSGRRGIGWSAAAAVLTLAALAALILAGFCGTPSAWHWLMPIGYAAFAAPRLAASRRIETSVAPDGVDFAEKVAGGAFLRFGGNGEVIDAGPAARGLLGIDPALLMGAGLFERVHLADRVAYLCALADARTSGVRRRAEVKLRLPGEAENHAAPSFGAFAIEVAAADDGSGEVIGVIRGNSEVVELRASAARADHLQERIDIAKSRFLAMVSHELRTPLNSIIGFSDMLLHGVFGGFSDPRQKEYVELVRNSGHHLLAVVNSILDVSKIEAGTYPIEPEPFRFGDAVDMCVAMLSGQAQAKSVTLGTRVAADLGDIRADRRAVQQMLINLVSNAVKFTQDGGRVDVSARRRGRRVEFVVEDTGIGIAEADLARIGTPFTQVQSDYTRQFEGTGLGLSLVKGLVALHEGTMSIESAPGEGTSVTITLPLDGPGVGVQAGEAEPLAMKPVRRQRLHDGTLRKAG